MIFLNDSSLIGAGILTNQQCIDVSSGQNVFEMEKLQLYRWIIFQNWMWQMHKSEN